MRENPENNKTAYLLELLPTVSKFAALGGTICGFIYLFAYSREAGIPFPLQLSVLPLTLIIVGLSAFGGVLILAFGVMIPAVLADDPLTAAKEFLLAREVQTHRYRVRLLRWFVCFMMPMLLSLSAVAVWFATNNNSPDWMTWVGWILVAASPVWIILTPYVVVPLRAKRIRYTVSTVFQTILAVWAYALLLFLIVAAVPSFGKWSVWEACSATCLIFSPLYFLSTFPPEANTATILLPPHYEQRAPTSTAIALTLAFVIAVWSTIQFPARIGGATLEIFRIGGGIPIEICLKDSPTAGMKKYIAFDENNCSDKVNLLFDGGDRLYLSPLNAAATAINNSKTTSMLKSPPISISQEAIFIKAYPTSRVSEIK